ncbi:MAG: metallophosphoesterase [Bacteroidetes bacterium]|nr:metallophosphoesterase [Bacteroidota bacterium]
MKKLFVLPAILIIFFFAGCKKSDTVYSAAKNVYTIAVLADNHYMDPSLLIQDGPAFQDYLVTNGKLLAASDAIMQEAVYELIHATPKPDLVLVPGDLTKDGELVSHVSVHLYLQQLIQAGIKVRVITGNHDIYNPNSHEYNGATQTRVQNIGPDKFRSIYSDCGYSDALYTDPYSLSYVSEPLPNLWLLAIDCCKYDNVYDSMFTAGAIRPGTMKWVLDRLAEAAQKGKTVFGMMHHGIVEQFTDKHLSFPGFMVDNYTDVSDQLMNAGLKIMFTGHFHATDITKQQSGNQTIYDIETGSIVVYPCAYRLITYIKDSSLIITTKHITKANYSGIPPGQTFPQYAESLTRTAADTLFTTMLIAKPFNYNDTAAWNISHCMGIAYMVHGYGDEDKPLEDTALIGQTGRRYGASSWLPEYCDYLWTDKIPKDNSLTIQLKSGISYK